MTLRDKEEKEMKPTQKPQLFWGDMHTNIHPFQVAIVNEIFEAARSHLDFFPVAYYPFFSYKNLEGLALESEGQHKKFLKDWQEILSAVRQYNEPGKFVTFAGYEWHGDRRRFGDHNVFYFSEGPLVAGTLPELYDHLRRFNGIAIPHHIAYQVGQRGKDWNYHDDKLSPFVEIFSDHGSSEGCNTPFTMNRAGSMGPRISGGTVQDGLARGYRLGIMASGDNHSGFPGVWGNGLVGVWAKDLSREGLWEAWLARRIYGVTGDRIRLDFNLNGHPMGSLVRSRGPVDIRAEIVGADAIDRVELLRNERVLTTYCHSGTWRIPKESETVRLKIRADFGWGPNEFYGLNPTSNVWVGKLCLDRGKLLNVQGCFSRAVQRVEKLSDREYSWELQTDARPYYNAPTSEIGWAGPVGWRNIQSLIFECESSLKDQVQLIVNGEKIRFSIQDALSGSHLLAFKQASHSNILNQLGLSRDQLDENAEVVWHNAHKVKVHVAIPESGYAVSFRFVDESPPAGRNWYRLRVSQLNGQMAWSSPIWLE